MKVLQNSLLATENSFHINFQQKFVCLEKILTDYFSMNVQFWDHKELKWTQVDRPKRGLT